MLKVDKYMETAVLVLLRINSHCLLFLNQTHSCSAACDKISNSSQPHSEIFPSKALVRLQLLLGDETKTIPSWLEFDPNMKPFTEKSGSRNDKQEF